MVLSPRWAVLLAKDGEKEIAFRKGTTLEYLHTDHLGSTSVTSNSSGAQVGKIAYFPFGSLRTENGQLNTDKLFTGQRLDETGLYFYNARYYDATIGRFISPDPTISSPTNPQNLNRYSYVLNNPLLYSDPSGLDVIIMGGNGQSEDDMQEYYDYLVDKGIIDAEESYKLLYDIDPPGNLVDVSVNARLDQLMTELGNDHKDIKLLGFSEGAATIGTFLSNLADNPNIVSATVRDQLRAAVMMECPAGFIPGMVTQGFGRSCLNDLPNRLAVAGAKSGFNIEVADVWNRASIVHGGQLEGWEGHSYSYDSRSWFERTTTKIAASIPVYGSLVVDASRATQYSSLHNNVLHRKCARNAIHNTFYH